MNYEDHFLLLPSWSCINGRKQMDECKEKCFTLLMVLFGEGHFPFILQVEPLNAPSNQVLPAWLHGCPQLTSIQ